MTMTMTMTMTMNTNEYEHVEGAVIFFHYSRFDFALVYTFSHHDALDVGVYP